MKKQAQNWEQIFTMYINNKGYIIGTYKEVKSSKNSIEKQAKDIYRRFTTAQNSANSYPFEKILDAISNWGK